MAVTVTIEDRIFHAVFSDPFAYEDFLTAWRRAIASPEFNPAMKPLIDVRRVSRSVPWSEIRDMVDFSFLHRDKFVRRHRRYARFAGLRTGKDVLRHGGVLRPGLRHLRRSPRSTPVDLTAQAAGFALRGQTASLDRPGSRCRLAHGAGV